MCFLVSSFVLVLTHLFRIQDGQDILAGVDLSNQQLDSVHEIHRDCMQEECVHRFFKNYYYYVRLIAKYFPDNVKSPLSVSTTFL